MLERTQSYIYGRWGVDEKKISFSRHCKLSCIFTTITAEKYRVAEIFSLYVRTSFYVQT